MYPARLVCDLFKISRETVRVWSVEFAQYLSPMANPGEGRQRQFSDSDLSVFALVAEMKGQGKLFEDVHLALQNGQRGSSPASINSLLEVQQPRDTPRALSLRREVERLQIELKASQEDSQRKAGQIELLTHQLEDAQKQIRELNRELGRLEGRLGE